MAGLFVHRSNHLELLLRRLAEVTEKPLRSPLQPEIVVVQSVGMRRWLSLQLADFRGISMNYRFPFPATFAQDIFRTALGASAGNPSFDTDILSWRVMARLDEVLGADDAALLRGYVADDASGLKRFQLCSQIANVFDRYILHRTEGLLEWQSAGKADSWQAHLWRLLTAGAPEANPPALLQRLHGLADGSQFAGSLPDRVGIFGISSLSPYFLNLLEIASRWMEVHLFLFEPTIHYWGDIQSTREQSKILRSTADLGVRAEDLHLDSGSPLLASMGKPARAFTRLVQELRPVDFGECFEEPPATSLLNAVRNDIYHLQSRTDSEVPAFVPSPGDRSIQIHCCHGPMREVEVLYDHLLDLFERLPGLTPKDILVMTPDIETYAPFIESVFSSPEIESARIPFTIADRRLQSEMPLAGALLALLELRGSRFSSTAVLSLLELAPIRDRFGIQEHDLGIIRDWLENSAIRWGIDGDHRAGFDLPPTDQNTWREGLDRLLLGYAFHAEPRELFEDHLPVTSIDPSQSELLGNFVEFVDRLSRYITRLESPRTLPEWAAALNLLVSTFLETDEITEEELPVLRSVVSRLLEFGKEYQHPVSFEVMREALDSVFSESESGFGFLAGHTTFCSLRPMRSVPFRIICMLGMNDGAFPRSDTPLAFDLTAAAARNRRDDDRQLFLETMLSARDLLYLSYSGLSLRDQSEAPPSVLVSELLDYLATNYGSDGESQNARERWVTRHRLQPFSTAYFGGDPQLFSYSQENSRAAELRGRRDFIEAPFISGPIATPEIPEVISLDDLARFFCHPGRDFVERCLRIRLPDAETQLEDCEPLSLNALDKTALAGEIVDALLAGKNVSDLQRVHRAAGLLPIGWAGDREYLAIVDAATQLVEAVREHHRHPELNPIEVDQEFHGLRVVGRVTNLRSEGALRYRAARMKANDYLRAWISHLSLNSAAPAHIPHSTVLYGIEKGVVSSVRFGEVTDARGTLSDLVDLYLQARREPLPYYPQSSWAYAEALWGQKKKGAVEARKAAMDAWAPANLREGQRAEKDDPYVKLCTRGLAEILSDAWASTTERVCKRLFESLSVEVTE